MPHALNPPQKNTEQRNNENEIFLRGPVVLLWQFDLKRLDLVA